MRTLDRKFETVQRNTVTINKRIPTSLLVLFLDILPTEALLRLGESAVASSPLRPEDAEKSVRETGDSTGESLEFITIEIRIQPSARALTDCLGGEFEKNRPPSWNSFAAFD